MNRTQLTFATIGNYIVLMFSSFDAQAINDAAISNSQFIIDFSYQFDELIKLFFSIIGGIVSTIVLNFLKRKFPDFFRMLGSSESNRTQS